jgi:hypothetical protein
MGLSILFVGNIRETVPITVDATGRYNRAYVGDSHRGLIAPAIRWSTAHRSPNEGDA